MKPDAFQKVSKRIGKYFAVRNVMRSKYFKDDTDADERNAENEKAFTGFVVSIFIYIIYLRKVNSDNLTCFI